jgi:ribosome-binding factor A
MLRVAELIRHAAAELLSRGVVEDDVLASHVVTVPGVKMSPDLKLATIYVMPLGGKDGDAVLKALERHKKFMRGEIAHRIHMKYAPELRFRIDESFDNAAKIDALLASPKVVRDLDHGEDEKDDGGESGSGGVA